VGGGPLYAERVTDSNFSRFFDVFTAKAGSKHADRHGRFPVPGDTTLHLPQERVRIYYDVNWGDTSEDSNFDAPDDLEVKITEVATGEEVPIRRKLGFGVSATQTKNFSRGYIGRIEVPREGDYKVEATASADPSEEPHLSLGK
jgi:hypothetical protein